MDDEKETKQSCNSFLSLIKEVIKKLLLIIGNVTDSIVINGNNNIVKVVKYVISTNINHRIRYTKVLTLVIVILICMGSFKIRFFEPISARVEHKVMEIGDRNKKHLFDDKNIANILIDSEGIDWNDDELKKWRKSCAGLIRKLSDVGARVIVLDMRFGKKLEDDIYLIEAIEQSKKRGTSVIIGFGQQNNGKPMIAEDFKNAVGDDYGMLTGKTRLGGVVFKVPLAVIDKSYSTTKKKYYSLSLKAVEAYLGGKIIDMKENDFMEHRIKISLHNICQDRICRFFSSEHTVFSKGIKSPIQEDDIVAYLYIDMSPNVPSHNKFSYEDIDKNRFFNDDRILLKNYNSKIVLVGFAEKDELFSTTVGKRYGVLIHADAINTLLNNLNNSDNKKAIRALAEWFEYSMIALFGVLGIIVNKYINQKQIKRLLFLKICLFFVIAASCFAFSIYLYLQERILINWIYYFITFLSTFKIAGFIMKRSSHEKSS